MYREADRQVWFFMNQASLSKAIREARLVKDSFNSPHEIGWLLVTIFLYACPLVVILVFFLLVRSFIIIRKHSQPTAQEKV